MSPIESGPGTVSSCIVPCDFHNLRLTSVTVRADAFQVGNTCFDASSLLTFLLLARQPTAVLRIVMTGGLVKKCGDFTAIYAGEVLNEAPHDTVPVRL